MDAATKKAERQLKKFAKLEEMLAREKERSQKLKFTIAQSKAKKAIRRSPGAPRVKRAQTVWVKALQQWNKGKEMYRIPKKGSAEYDEVFALKQQMAAEIAKETEEMKATLNKTPPFDMADDDGTSPPAEDFSLQLNS